jgi:parvulin-like peptidyl-prolyl isomerase
MCGNRRFLAVVPAVAAALCLLAAGCGRGKTSPPASQTASGVQNEAPRGPILQVESAVFTNDDLKAYFRAVGGSDIGSLSPESMSRLFDRFVDEKIMLEAARRQNLTLSDEEKKSYLAKRAGESLSDRSGADGRTAARDNSFDGLLAEKYAFEVVRDIQVDESEIEAYYEEHKKDFLLPERVQVSQILVPTEEKAVSVLRRIGSASEAEFRKVAREESSGPEAFKGGVMGVYKQGDLPHDMEKVIFALDEGKVSQVVESSYGYHVFRLDKKFPPQLESVEEAAPGIRVRVLEQKIKDALAAHLAGLKGTLSWKIFSENLFFAYQKVDQ